jgi:hypothetical protein
VPECRTRRYGIAAIDNAHFYVANARYVFGDLNTWGWFLLALGVAQGFAERGELKLYARAGLAF